MIAVIRRLLARSWTLLAIRNAVEFLGVRGAVAYWMATLRGTPASQTSVHLRTRVSRQPLLLRGGGSDLRVLGQIVVHREYWCLDHLPAPTVIVDCGANIGLASLYFLWRWPGARVIAIEADADNADIARHNLAPFGERAVVIHAGVWSRSCELRMEERVFRDGDPWARQVRECSPGETGTFRGVSVADILVEYGIERVSLLKVDIEGAEVEMLRTADSWIDKVGCLAIELHDDSHFGNATAAFEAAVAGRGFRVHRIGETTICERVP